MRLRDPLSSGGRKRPRAIRHAQQRPTEYLFVLNRVDDASGGTLAAALNLAEALTSGGNSVTLTAPFRKGRSYNEVELADRQNQRLTLKLFNANWLGYRMGLSGKQIFWLIGSGNCYDRIHVHSVYYAAAVYSTVIGRIWKIPVFWWPHGSLDVYDIAQNHRTLKRLINVTLMRLLLLCTRALLCTTEREDIQVVQALRRPGRQAVIPLPVSGPPAPPRAGWLAERQITGGPVISFVGRIAPKKRLDRLICAVELLRDSFPELRLVIAGDGDDTTLIEDLKRLVRSKHLDSHVHFAGWLTSDAKWRLLAETRVFVLPSENENFGVAVVEAMMVGVPVVITRHVYLSEQLARDDAAVVVDDDPKSIACGIRSLIISAERASQVGEAGRSFASREFALSKVGERIAALGNER